MFLRISLLWMLAHSRTHLPVRARSGVPVLLLLLLLTLPIRARAPRISTGANDGCQPTALVFCEMPVIASPSAEGAFVAFPGEELRLPCQAYGSPSPLITWHRVLANGESIPLPAVAAAPAPPTDGPRLPPPPLNPGVGDHYVRNEAGTLCISHVVPHDAGKYYCMAENSVGTAQALVDVQVSQPLSNLIPLTVGDTFVVITWNGTVDVPSLGASTPTRGRHHHHVETRTRLSRHLFLKYRRISALSSPTHVHVVRLAPLSRKHRVNALVEASLYEFCLEFEPHGRPSTLLDCITLRTVEKEKPGAGPKMGYHEGPAIMFVLLVAIVASVACMCFGCYGYAIGRKLWKYRGKKGFTSLGYTDEMNPEEDAEGTGRRRAPNNPYSTTVNHRYPSTDAYNYADTSYQDDNPKKPLIARI